MDNETMSKIKPTVTVELARYQNAIEDGQTPNPTPLLKALGNEFHEYDDHIIYFNIHAVSDSYIDNEFEYWEEDKHTLEVALLSLTPPLLKKLETLINGRWMLKRDKDGVMTMSFVLDEHNIVMEACNDKD